MWFYDCVGFRQRTVRRQTIANFIEKASRLYEQERSAVLAATALEMYVTRWLWWGEDCVSDASVLRSHKSHSLCAWNASQTLALWAESVASCQRDNVSISGLKDIDLLLIVTTPAVCPRFAYETFVGAAWREAIRCGGRSRG